MSDVHPLLRNAVIATVWVSLLAPFAAGCVAVSAYAVRLGFRGELTIPDIALGPQSQLMVVLAIAGGYGFVVWMAVRETFGGEDVDDGVTAATDAIEEASESIDD